jgi:hypothetical protein
VFDFGWRRWLRTTFGTPARRPHRRRDTRPRLEPLEPRWVPAFTSTTALTITPTEGTAFTGTTVAAFTTDTPGDTVTASIDWGDGTTTPGTVSVTGSNGTVTGGHTYADEGTFTPKVALTETGSSPDTKIVNSTATVAEADSLFVAGASFGATEGKAFSGQVAQFVERVNGYAGNTAADFTARITWGDGTTSAGTVSGSAGLFSVSGSHTYADEGTYSVGVQVADDAPGTASASATGSATVAEADTLAVAGILTSPTEGVTFRGEVATIRDNGYPGNTAADFTARITWGDGATSAGTVSGSDGVFTVSGTHIYGDEATYGISIQVADDNTGTIAFGAAAAEVGESDSLSGTGIPIHVAAGTIFEGPVATFTSSYTSNNSVDFNAPIDWGDGNVTAGDVTGSDGNFTVSGIHAYAGSGTFNVSVQIVDDPVGTAFVTARSTATVTTPPPTTSPGPGATPPQGPAQQPGPTQLQVLEMEVDALLVSEGVLFNNPSLLQLGLGGFFLETANQPANVQSQLKQDFVQDDTTDTDIGLAQR